MPWMNARVAHLLSVCRAVATVVGDKTEEKSSSNGYDEVVVTKNMETIDAFSSCVIHMRAERAYTGECTKENAGKCIHTELRQGSKKVVMVVRNSMAYPLLSKRKLWWPGQWP